MQLRHFAPSQGFIFNQLRDVYRLGVPLVSAVEALGPAVLDQLETIRGPLLKVCPRRNRSFTSIERPDQMCARHFVVKIRMRLSEAAVASGAVGGGIEAVAVECRRGREKNDCRAIRLKVGSLGNGRGSVVERPYAAPTAWSPDQ